MRCVSVLLCVALLVLAAAAAQRTAVTSCFVYYRNVLDLSYTYNFNKARIAAHMIVINEYTSVTFLSKSVSDFILAENGTVRTAQLLAFLDGGHCDLCVSMDPLSWADVDINAVAARFPTIQFIENSAERLLRTTVAASNYAAFSFDYESQYFAAGYLAGKHSSTCVGLVFTTGPATAVTSFYHGMQAAVSGAALIATNVSTTHSDLLVDLFGKAGCEVVFAVSDRTLVYPGLVATASDKYPMMSIGIGNDASTIYGDSVLTSVFNDLTQFFADMTRKLVLGETFTIPTMLNATLVATLSPLANTAAKPVIRDGLCDRVWTDKEETVHTTCPTALQRLSFSAVDRGVQLRPTLKGPTACPAGTTYQYNISDFNIICTKCLAGTFSAAAGATVCLPCENDLVAPEPGSTSCVPSPEESKAWVLVVAVLVPLFVIILILTLLWLINRSTADRSRDSAYAPRGPAVVLGMLGVDQTASSKKWRSSLSRMCTVYDKVYFLVSRTATANDVYVFTSVGDIVMVAAATEQKMLAFFSAAAAESAITPWGCEMVLKFAMHAGTPSVVVNEHANVDTARVAYTGPDVELLRALWKVETRALVIASTACVGGGTATIPQAEFTPTVHNPEQNIHYKCINQYGTWVLPAAPPPGQHPDGDEFGGRTKVGQQEEEAITLGEDEDEEGQEETEEKATNPLSSKSLGSEGGAMELDGLLDPPSLGKHQIEAIRGLCVDFIQKLLMVMQFEEQLTLVSHIATALHVPKPAISSTPSRKKSSNMLRPCTRLICQQLLATVDEDDMLRWIAGLKEEDGDKPKQNADQDHSLLQ